MRRLFRALIIVLALLLVAGAAAGLWIRGQLRASLAQLDGTARLPDLASPVTVTRDNLGVPTITGASRTDVARATGFLHAQDRFFQMDLARRRAAGELSALVGGVALGADRQVRLHRFRAIARQVVASADEEWRALIGAYTEGVNSGLDGLDGPPFEYLLLRQDPQPWTAEDSVLVVLSMFITLQLDGMDYESTLAAIHDALPPEMASFVAPRGTEWDAPLLGEAFAVPPIPGPDVYDLRTRRSSLGPDATSPRVPSIGALGPANTGSPAEAVVGSNNWAVSGQLTADGRAVVANDMHLAVRVPDIWYRAVLEWPDAAEADGARRLMGVTLPGVPTVVVGSNRHVAWGFTNSQGDYSDLILLELNPDDPGQYRTPDGWHAFDVYQEVIAMAGEADHVEPVQWTIWGPVVGPDHAGRLRALRWVAHDAERLGGSPLALETARTVEDAFAAVNGLGTPAQNFVVADEAGRIGWTIFGSIPRRVGFDGRLPMSWADGSRGWNGYLDPSEYPRIVDPANGRLWTANARTVDGEMLARLGDGNYAVGARARIIRDRLFARDRFDEADLLDVQLDTSATYLDGWRSLLLDTLTPDRTNGHADRETLRRIVDEEWTGQASADSAAYRLTMEFRNQVSPPVALMVMAEVVEADPTFQYGRIRLRDGPLLALLRERPAHLLDSRYGSWDEVLLDSVDAVIARAESSGGLTAPWWQDNLAPYQHPLSAAVPFLSRWLDMPMRPLPGSAFTPRMHSGTAAASERMVVSPGHEEDGIMEMPTGQSGHPLSPFYANSHDAWVNGEATPFLPGPAEHTLTLAP